MKGVIILALTLACVECDNLVYINKVLDKQLLLTGDLLRQMHIKYINIGNLTISNDIRATNVKLGDVTKVVRRGDATLQTGQDTIDDEFSVGIDKLNLLMDSLYLDGKTYDKVLVLIFTNSLSVSQKTYSTRTSCNQTYTGMSLSEITGAMLYSRPTTKMNITMLFIQRVVPYINQQLSSPQFEQLVQKYMDSCSSSSQNSLLDFLTNISEDDSSPLYPLSAYPSLSYNTAADIPSRESLSVLDRLRKLRKNPSFNDMDTT